MFLTSNPPCTINQCFYNVTATSRKNTSQTKLLCWDMDLSGYFRFELWALKSIWLPRYEPLSLIFTRPWSKQSVDISSSQNLEEKIMFQGFLAKPVNLNEKQHVVYMPIYFQILGIYSWESMLYCFIQMYNSIIAFITNLTCSTYLKQDIVWDLCCYLLPPLN